MFLLKEISQPSRGLRYAEHCLDKTHRLGNHFVHFNETRDYSKNNGIVDVPIENGSIGRICPLPSRTIATARRLSLPLKIMIFAVIRSCLFVI